MSKKIVVGTNQLSYLEKRNFSELPFSNPIEFKKCADLYKIYNYILFKSSKKIIPNYQFSFKDFGLNNVSLFHFFSAVYFGSKPWIVTSSVPIPRWINNHKIGFDLLEKNNCKAIILLSENCKSKQLKLIKRFNANSEVLEQKMHVIHPSQSPLIESFDQKEIDSSTLTFTLIGHQVLIKGGLEVVRVFNRLNNEGISNIKLNLVSLLHKSGFLDYQNSGTDIEEIKNKISSCPLINHIPFASNQEVIDLLRATDVSLLPSYGDSYGYSVLEAQAAGCPVITTNTGALSEINNNEIGWVLKMKVGEDYRAVVENDKSRSIFSADLEEQLYRTIKNMLNDRQCIIVKGKMSLQKIIEKHNPKDRAEAIQKLYLAALKS